MLEKINLEKYAESIIDKLPHGSGINYTWRYDVLKNGKVKFYNSYDAMDEWGGYCHVYDFTITIQPSHESDFTFSFCGQRERVCCGYGLRDYLEETIYESLTMAE